MYSFRTLGSLELRSDSGEEITGVISAQKLVALLAYLCVAQPHGFHRRDTVVGLLWPELTQDRARAALRHAVYRIRGFLGPDAITSRGDEDLGLNEKILSSDAQRFQQLMQGGAIGEALDLYKGDLLPGFFLRGAPEYERWLDTERSRLRTTASTAACKLAEQLSQSGDREEAARRARQALRIAPDEEGILRRAISVLAAGGDLPGALKEYDAFARRLKEDYDGEPAAETKALIEKLRASPPVTLDVPDPSHPLPRAPVTATSHPQNASRFPRWAVAAVALAITLAASAYAVERIRDNSADASPTIAVLPFQVRGSRDLDYLREGMSDMLSIGVDGAAGLQSADPRAVIARIRKDGDFEIDADEARDIAHEVGAGLYITGSVIEVGGQLRITAEMHDRDGRVRARAETGPADKGKLFELVDDLSRSLLAEADPSAQTLTGLAARTTRSLPALRSYLTGERELRAGRHVAALDAFREAVSKDSAFALAYYRLSSAGRWTTEYQLAEDATDKAVRYDESLPPYARRLLDAATAMRDGNYAKSESLYVASTRSRPGDAETWFGLGDLYYHYNALRGRSKREARRPFERALSLDPGDGESRVHLLELAAWEGRVREVDSLLAALPPGSDFGAKWPIVRALITDDRLAENQALSTLKTGDERSLVLMVIHSTSAFPSNLPGALRVTGMLTDPARSPARRAYGYNLRAQVQLARGRWLDAKQDLTAMATIEPAAAIEYGALLTLSPTASASSDDLRRLRTALATWDAGPTPPSASPVFGIHNGFHPQLRLYLLGLVSVRLGDAAAALAYADSLTAIPADSIKALLGQNLAHAVRARVIARRGDVNGALAELGQPWIDPRTHRSHYSSILAQVGDRYFRAELLQKAGRLAEALDAYSAVSDYSLDGLMYLPLSSLRRGDIYLQMRDRPQAIAHYQRFVDLWKDCDPRLAPLRNAAVTKIASLQR